MRLSKLSATDQRLVAAGLVSDYEFVRSVAQSVEKTDSMSDKQRRVLNRPFVRTGYYYAEYDSTEAAMEDNDFADAMGGSPWGDD